MATIKPVRRFLRHDLRYTNVTAHEMVAAVAVGFAQEVYEELASRNNAFFEANRDRDDFVRQCAPTLRQDARAALATMLADPDLPDAQKQLIHEAIVLDASLPTKGTSMVKRGTYH